MNHDRNDDHDPDDAGDDLLAAVDLHTWRVPPRPAIDRSALVMRALAPAIAPPRRPLLPWILAVSGLLAAVIAIVVVVLVPRPTEIRTTVAAPAGGGAEARMQEILQRLEQEQHELEARLAEIQELRARVLELSEKIRQYEQRERHDHTVPKPAAPPVTPQAPPQPSAPAECDEVSCVLSDDHPECCAKYRRPLHASPMIPASPLPSALDRGAISNGIGSVKAAVAACRGASAAKGTVKLHVQVGGSGLVERVTIEAAPDEALGACVARAVQNAVFARTRDGGSFNYPFVF